MDTTQIDDAMSRDACLRKTYGGTWSIDNFPAWSSDPCCYIINLSPSWHRGSHWTAVYRDKHRCEYFCSYGSRAPKEIRRLMGRNYSESGVQLQTINSDLCGQYCILYIMCRCRGGSLNDFLDCFSGNCVVNDYIICDFFK